jgi:hypothetical protein
VELAEVKDSFAVLSPRREIGGWSLAATLMIGVPEETREAQLQALGGFPERFWLELEDGRRLEPAVDKGLAPEGGRLPAVLALRWLVPDGAKTRAFVSEHPVLSGRWAAPALGAWSA